MTGGKTPRPNCGSCADRRGFPIAQEYVDHASGSRNDRAEYRAMLEAARRRQFDVLLVWRYDRFARSTRELVNALEEFNSLGIDFVAEAKSIRGQELGDLACEADGQDVSKHRGGVRPVPRARSPDRSKTDSYGPAHRGLTATRFCSMVFCNAGTASSGDCSSTSRPPAGLAAV
jgi:hypothetical protein